jgi:hypothetical protein
MGGQSTASAKFAFINNTGSGVPTASIAGTTSDVNTYLTGEGTLGTTNMAPLTLGSSSTGPVQFYNSGNFINDSGNLTIAGNLVSGGTISLPNSAVLTGDTTYLRSSTGVAFGADETYYIDSDGTGNLNAGTFAGLVTANGGLTVADGQTTTLASFTSNGGVLYTNDSGVVAQATAGTDTQVLHGGTNPSFSAVDLTADVTGVLPIASGGTNNSDAYTAGSIIFSDGTSLTQNNSMLFWDNTNFLLGVGTTSPTAPLHVYGQYSDNAAAIVDQENSGDIFTASASGIPRFTISNAGNIALNQNSQINTAGTLLIDSTGVLSLNTVNNQAITTGTGLTTLGGDLTINGTVISLAGATGLIDSTTGTLSINTTNDQAITTGTGITTLGGNLVLNNNASTTTFGGIAYTWPTTQDTNFILQTNGSSQLQWVDPALVAASVIFWNQSASDGLLFPKNSTVDVTIGGQ